MRKLILIGFLGLLLVPGALSHSTSPRYRTVLVIHSGERFFPEFMQVESALRESLGVDTDPSLAYLTEFLDLSRFGNTEYDKLITDFFRSKYAGQSIDVVVAVGPHAFQLLRGHQKDLFVGVPVVFCGVGREEMGSQPLPPHFIGVPVVIEPRRTLDLALRLQPDAREIVVVTGASDFDRSWEETLRKDLPMPPINIPIRYFSGMPLGDLLQELSHLPRNTIVYTPSLLSDGAGKTYLPPVVLRQMSKVASAPLYDPYSTQIGNGVVGGYFFTMDELGRQAGELVKRLLNGENVNQADLPSALPSYFVVDWTQLQRWHLSESRLPPGTVVKFRALSPWQKYRYYILAGVLALVLQALLIVGLALEARKRRESELELKSLTARLINAQEEERRRIARELHDDLNQRLALLVTNLEHLATTSGESSTPLDLQILGVSREVAEISGEISQLSHRLHSSALDILGLVPALRRLTGDLTQSYGISIGFTSNHSMAVIPPDVAMCLFRVTQEALTNVAKHSGAKSAEVTLTSPDKSKTIQLTITDDGKGFDAARLRTDSLGIISMRERLRIVGGELKILSLHMKGTEIRAQVPLRDVPGQTDHLASSEDFNRKA